MKQVDGKDLLTAQPSIMFEIFEEVRRQGLPLGLTEYLTLATAAEEGRGLESYAQFKNMCRLLWANSTDDYVVIDQAFARIVDPWLLRESAGEQSSPKTHPPHSDHQKSDDQKGESSHSPSNPPVRDALKDATVPLTAPTRLPIGGRPFPRASGRGGSSPHRFVMTPRWPVPLRTMATHWRFLRQPRRQGPLVELDVEGTIHRMAQSGLFLGPVFRPARTNQAHLLLLIDQGGSMIPFSPLMSLLKESVRLGGFQGRLTTWYYHDVPHPLVYAQPALIKSCPLHEVLAQQVPGCHVVVVSDAGAARGTWESRRFELSKQAMSLAWWLRSCSVSASCPMRCSRASFTISMVVAT